jgi:hypothetical protein
MQNVIMHQVLLYSTFLIAILALFLAATHVGVLQKSKQQ